MSKYLYRRKKNKMSKNTARFDVLDSWRGICAMIVMLGHFLTFFRNEMTYGIVVANNYLCVDFFFVLSGFVMAYTYWGKIRTAADVARFTVVRWGRIYPLHAFMLVLFLGLEYARSVVEGDAMFSGIYKSLPTYIGNIFLVQAMGVFNHVSWNIPSWSISVEFFTYIVFAVLILLVGTKYRNIVFGAIIVMSPIALLLLGGRYECDYTYDYGFLRCLTGFFAGVLTCRLYQHSRDKLSAIGHNHATCLEAMMLLAAYLFFRNVDNTYLSYISPLLFSVCVLVFALEKGMISSFLKARPFLYLGALSYSLYMTHAFVQRVMVNGIDIVEKHVGLDIVKKSVNLEDPSDAAPYFDVSIASSWGLTVVMVGAVVVFSTLTYYFIEKPSYKWIKNRAGQ